jgi:hypothetical protein
VPALVSAMQERERRRESLTGRLRAAEAWSKNASLDSKRFERELPGNFAD